MMIGQTTTSSKGCYEELEEVMAEMAELLLEELMTPSELEARLHSCL